MSLARSGRVEVVVSSAEARFDCVAELWLGGELFAATQVDDGELTLSIDGRSDGSSLVLPVAALLEALGEAERLLEPPSARGRKAELPPVEATADVGSMRAAIGPAVRSHGNLVRVSASRVRHLARRRRTTAMTIPRRVPQGEQAATIAASAVEPGSVISLGSDGSVRIMVSRVAAHDGRVVLDGTNEINGTEVSLMTAPSRLVVRHGAVVDAARPSRERG
ncbi:MAG: hypothetical protein ABI317_00515 [Gaiellales bacterium]